MIARIFLLFGVVWVLLGGAPSRADESVFVKNLKADTHEKILYLWTRDADHKENDFLAVVDVDPKSGHYGKIIATVPTNSSANEAHHFGYTANTDRIFGAGMMSNKMFIYDLKTDSRKPELIRTVDLNATNYLGPHTMYAVPEGVLVAMLGKVDGGGPGALVLLDNDGNFKQAWPVVRSDGSPGYMYDVGVKHEMNRAVTSSWAHPGHIKAGDHPQHSGKDVAVWDWKAKKIVQIQEVDPAPLEVRWMHGPEGRGGFTNCAFGDSVWYWEDADKDGRLEFERVIRLPEKSTPADMRISYDNQFLYVSLWGGGKVQQYNIANPKSPKFVSEVSIPQPNMMKLSADSRRLYVTNSLLSSLDGDVRFGAWLLNVGPEGMKIDERFKPDFMSFATGPAGPHDMLLR
jgi:selenium-binding protein 1